MRIWNRDYTSCTPEQQHGARERISRLDVHDEEVTKTIVKGCRRPFVETARENSNYLSVNGTDSIGKSAYCFQPVGG